MEYKFDRFLKFQELTNWLKAIVSAYPHLIHIESYGKSNEGRELWLATITDLGTGVASHKPAHWVDANIHATETTSGVAACYLIQYLIDGFSSGDKKVMHALKTRAFYVVPRVNPDGVEAALSDRPKFLRSSTRYWPWQDSSRKQPGIEASDIDGDGKILTMRVQDDNGAWVEHPSDPRVMIPVDHELSPALQGADPSVPRFRILPEGLIENYDGFTIPTPPKAQGLDLNRNFPAGWSKDIKGSGDHAMSEPEIYHLVRAIADRPNICGYNAYHTSGGILLRPSSMKSDTELPVSDVWVWKEMGRTATSLTGSPLYQCYDDFTWDKNNAPMSGAADDFMYDHFGVFSWTTEFWDVIHEATGVRASTKIWYLGPTVEQELAIAKWADRNAPGSYHNWRDFQHPQLGLVQLGGADHFNLTTNPPGHLMLNEVKGHAEFAVYQALLSPQLEILQASAEVVCFHNDPTSTDVDSRNKHGSKQRSKHGTPEKDPFNGAESKSNIIPPSSSDVSSDETSAKGGNEGKKSWNQFALNLVETIASPPPPVKPKPKCTWRVMVGVANTGFLPTNVSEMGTKINVTLPVEVEIYPSEGYPDLSPADGHSPMRTSIGQLSGRLSTRVEWSGCDGTPDRALCTWLITAAADLPGIHVVASHPRAGKKATFIALKN